MNIYEAAKKLTLELKPYAWFNDIVVPLHVHEFYVYIRSTTEEELNLIPINFEGFHVRVVNIVNWHVVRI